jgi:predicted dehydrogenase
MRKLWRSGTSTKQTPVPRHRPSTFAQVYGDFRTMIEREKLDAVDIVTPVGTHATLTSFAADAG